MIKYLLFPFRLIWRLWFYVLILVSVVVMSPFLLILTSSEKYMASLIHGVYKLEELVAPIEGD